MTARQNENDQIARPLSRQETHDLSMILKDRVKVLKAHAAEQAAKCLADFERQMATIYKWDEDQVWAEAMAEAGRIVADSQKKIAARCKALGIPERFAPELSLQWQGRGEAAARSRRAELRRVAEASIAQMQRAAELKIEKQSLALRTQVVAMGALSAEARLFLESLASVDEAMRGLEFGDVEKKLEADKTNMRRLSGY